jgi:hypothetical protein
MKSIEDMQKFAERLKPLFEGEMCGACNKPVSSTEDVVIEYFTADTADPYDAVHLYHWACIH